MRSQRHITNSINERGFIYSQTIKTTKYVSIPQHDLAHEHELGDRAPQIGTLGPKLDATNEPIRTLASLCNAAKWPVTPWKTIIGDKHHVSHC